MGKLEGVKMEIDDSAYPLVKSRRILEEGSNRRCDEELCGHGGLQGSSVRLPDRRFPQTEGNAPQGPDRQEHCYLQRDRKGD